jgi:transposase
VQLAQIEAAFKTMKSELGIRPLYHQLGYRVEAHILVAFLAYCLLVTLKNRLQGSKLEFLTFLRNLSGCSADLFDPFVES